MDFWKRVLEELDKKNMTRADLADKTLIKADTINKSIARNSEVTVLMASKIASALDVSIGYLFGWTDNIESSKLSKSELSVDSDKILLWKYKTHLLNLEKLSEEKKELILKLTESLLH